MREIIERLCFRAHDAEGNQYTVHLLQEFDVTKDAAGSTQRQPTGICMETDQGARVHFISADVFEVVMPQGNVRITPDDVCGPNG